MRRPKKKFKPRRKEDPNRINERIRVPKIRLVGEGREPQVMDTKEALKIAEDEGLDLVEISPKAEPPVCKILDYKKYLYKYLFKLIFVYDVLIKDLTI
mgnify:CR=1 FL=1